MDFVKRLSLLVVTCSLLGAQSLPEDPVMKARTLRAQAQGINEADLPPVPRSVLEPPPLPPPEVHRKDSRGGQVARVGAKAKRGKHLKQAAKAPQHKKLAKVAGKHGKARKKGKA